jgi:peptidoglycan/LPS O-acetylase OafA/YrhL
LLENRVVVYIGTISYGLYVYHLFMSSLYFDFVAPTLSLAFEGKGTIWLMYFILLFLVSSLSYYLLEKPLNSLKKYFSYSPSELPLPENTPH